MRNNAFTSSFTHSRTILTLWYVAFCLALIALLNFGAFAAQSASLQVPGVGKGFGFPSEVISDDTLTLIKTGDSSAVTSLNAIRQRFGYTLIIADSTLFIFAVIFSYILAGFTLNPVRKVMQQQEEFAQEVSHELRTPLSIIALELETLKRSESTSSLEAVSHIGNELRRMNRLVDSLLILVQPNNEQVSRPQSFDVTKATKAVFAQLQKVAASKKLAYSFDSTYIGRVVADQHDIEQAVRILLENAIKYSPKRSSVLLRVMQHSKRETLIQVIDTGPGIATGDLPYVFDRFYRGRYNKINATGLGLGLAIAKKTVTQHRGRVTIQSQPGKGTTASIYLPTDQSK